MDASKTICRLQTSDESTNKSICNQEKTSQAGVTVPPRRLATCIPPNRHPDQPSAHQFGNARQEKQKETENNGHPLKRRIVVTS
jgi:hypothetical protein